MGEVTSISQRKSQNRGGFFRSLQSILSGRALISSLAGKTFRGERDVFDALGYKKELSTEDYWDRYRRNEVAARVIEAYPLGTWRGIGEIFDAPDDEEQTTEFETVWKNLAFKLQVWPAFRKADILAGLGRFAIILIGAPGSLNTPLRKTLALNDLAFLQPYSERDVEINELETGSDNPRFGEVITYKIKKVTPPIGAKTIVVPERIVHWTRVIHVSDGLLDNNIFGLPRLERVWNRIDDLEKVVGSGSEAFWLRAHQGYQLDLDKELELPPDEQEKLDDEVEDFKNGISRFMQTRGIKLEALGSDVAEFGKNVESILGLIAAGSGIPQRILSGSERGQLASQQDRVNWTERVKDRRNEYAGPVVVHQFIKRMIDHGILPSPKEGRFHIWWPDVFDLSDDERAIIAGRWAEINQKNKSTVVLTNEIRARILDLKPLKPEEIKTENDWKEKTRGQTAPTENPGVPSPNPKQDGERPKAGART